MKCYDVGCMRSWLSAVGILVVHMSRIEIGLQYLVRRENHSINERKYDTYQISLSSSALPVAVLSHSVMNEILCPDFGHGFSINESCAVPGVNKQLNNLVILSSFLLTLQKSFPFWKDFRLCCHDDGKKALILLPVRLKILGNFARKSIAKILRDYYLRIPEFKDFSSSTIHDYDH